MLKPTPENAKSFALMLHIGLPPTDAIAYFLPVEEMADPSIVAATRELWLRSPLVQKESEKLMGGKWEEMSLEARIKVSLDKHYAEKAYFLFNHNFSELTGGDLTKAQEARKVLEAKMAGTSGKLDPLAEFYNDLKTGRVKIGRDKADPLASLAIN